MSLVSSMRNPFRKHQCPMCFKWYYPGNCSIYSSINQGKEIDAAPQNFWKKSLRRTFPIRLVGPRYVQELARRKCPHCGELLPFSNDLPHVKSYIIAVVGPTSAGKSHYIASLIKQLKDGVAQPLLGYTQFMADDGTTEKTYLDKYYKPLFVEKRHIPLNQADYNPLLRPLVYRMVIPPRMPGDPIKHINFFFYDASGEYHANDDLLVRYTKYILHASALIFLADPLKMDGIVKNLPFRFRPDPSAASSTPYSVNQAADVLNSILNLIALNQGREEGLGLGMPIAITLSKSDILRELVGITARPRFLMPSAYHHPQAVVNDFTIVNREVSSLVDKYQEKSLLNATRNLPNVSYFAISATGFSKDAQNKYPDVEPLRCLDPLLWILWRIGALA